MAKVAHNIHDKLRTGDVQITESVDFGSLLLSDNVLKGLKNSGFVRPSPIQLKAIPLGRCGLDLIVQAKSGTGKTCVFSVIALESIVTDTASTQVLVLAPTREIAVQIWEVINSIGSAIKELECHTFIGGLPLQEDRIKLKKCHIAVGTPGRVKQLIEGGVLRTDSLRLFILDEADKLLEESFQEQINWIYSTLPENKQMLALSATYPEYLADHLTAYMRNPTFLRLNISDPALLGIRQYYQTVPYHPLSHVIFEEKSKVLSNILSSVSFQQCLVFSNLQTRAQTLADSLTSHGWPTACIAGCLDQKDRNHAMAKLKTYKCRILISTDLTSRGIDADKVNMVINLDVPKDHETYLHRIGRAGRFGSFGIAVSLVSDGQEKLNLDSIEKRCNTQIYPLPEPLPSDLAKPDSPIFLDDVVSSEVINTENNFNNQSSPLKQKLKSSSRSVVSDDSNTSREDRNGYTDLESTGNASCERNRREKGILGDMKVTSACVEDGNTHSKFAKMQEDNMKDFVKNKIDEELLKQTVEIRPAPDYEDGENLEENVGKERIDSVKDKKEEKMSPVNTNEEIVSSGADLEGFDSNISLVRQAELSSKLDVMRDDSITPDEVRNETVHSVHISDIHSRKICMHSALNFDKVSVSNVFKNSTGYKRLNKCHSYNAAKEALKMYRDREKLETDQLTIDNTTDCSIPKLESDNKESETLKRAISQLQDLLENHLSVYSTESSNVYKVPETPPKVNEVDSISSEDEFEAKEEMLDRSKNLSPLPGLNVAFSEEKKLCDLPAKLEDAILDEKVDGFCDKPKVGIKKNFKKSKKQRFGYQGNFAIGHLLQQERDENIQTKNTLDDGRSKGVARKSPEQDCTKKSDLADTLAVSTSDPEFVPENVYNIKDTPEKYLNISRKTDETDMSECRSEEGGLRKTFLSSLTNEQKIASTTFSRRKGPDEYSINEKEGEYNIRANGEKETDSDSVPSTTDSESTDLGAILKVYKKTRKSPDRSTRQPDRARSSRYNVKSDSKSEDSGVYSRPSYQEQWRQWYEQYENWQQQSMNMLGNQGMMQDFSQDMTGWVNRTGYGYPSWDYPATSMYYPYQNYPQSYPYDYSMYHQPNNQHPSSSHLTEQIGNAFQFQEEYLKQMSKPCLKGKKIRK